MYVSVCVCVYKPTGVFVYSHLHTHHCAYRDVKQGGRQYTITHYICYSRHVHACLHLGTNTEPCTAPVAATQAAALLGEPQAGRRQVGREQANNCQQRSRWGRCWWVVRPSLRVAWACSAPNCPCRAVIGNKWFRTWFTAERLEPQGMWLAVHRHAGQHLGVSLKPGQEAAAPHVAILPIIYFMAYFNHLIKLHSSDFH